MRATPTNALHTKEHGEKRTCTKEKQWGNFATIANMTAGSGKIIIAPDLNIWPHELETAKALALAGMTVEFIRRSEEQHATSADVLIDGIQWEMKAPKGESIKIVERNLRRAIRQSTCIIFDSRRIKRIPDKAIERELRTCCAGRVKGIRHLLFVNRHTDVIDIK